jgi:RNA polymerase sigma factor (sigma-70 family)
VKQPVTKKNAVQTGPSPKLDRRFLVLYSLGLTHGKENSSYQDLRNTLVDENRCLIRVALNELSIFENHQYYDEYTSIANAQLMRCVEKFEPQRGFEFSTYAISSIILRFKSLANRLNLTIHVPVHVLERAAKLSVQNKLSTTEARFLRDVRNVVFPVSLDAKLHLKDGEKGSIADLIPAHMPTPEEELLKEEAWAELRTRLGKVCTIREIEMLRFRFAEKMSLQEIGDVYEISRERVRQITDKARKKLVKIGIHNL